MLSPETFTKDMLSNPALISNAMINALESSDTQEVPTINDPNNGFVMQFFGTANLVSKLSEKIDYVNNYFYRNRARNSEQLYAHISEFDYVKLMASPATLPFTFAMNRDWVIANAVAFDTNYNRIQIPATSYITMGGMTYSMYYPIDILVNKNTNAITAFYNTDTLNSLHTLETNMLLDTREYTQDGLNWFQIQFNMYQFNREIKTHTVGSEQGFTTTLSYEDQFYAIKIFRKDSSGNWVELSYSLSQLYYDYQTPTALITLLTDSSQVKIEIPQIYFHSGLISQNIRVELYTTRGAINYALSPSDLDDLRANFDTKSSADAAPLEQMPITNLSPTIVEVQGGTDAKTYSEMRESVLKNRLYSRAAITLDELVEAGLKQGFTLTRYVDDLTERIYYASNILQDSDGMVIPTFTGSILLKDENLTGNPSTILNFTDGYKTLLPTTVFKINDGLTNCSPLNNGEVAALNQMTKAQLVDELNKGVYVRQPFHITLLTIPKSPKASIYNLLSPSTKSLSFVAENSNSAPQMSVLACQVNHQNDGTGGYQLLMSVQRSSNIKDADISNFRLYFTCKSKIGEDVYIPAEYLGPDSNGDDIWEIILGTNYHITIDDHITMSMWDSNDTQSYVEIPLTQTFNIVSSFIRGFDPNIPVELPLNALLPDSMDGSQVVMCHQELIVEFGKNLSDRIYCGVNTSWGSDVYDTADETIYYTTGVPIFQTNENGIPEGRTVSSSSVELVLLHAKDSTPPSTANITTKTSDTIPVSSSPALLLLEDTTGVLVGMDLWGTNIPVGSKVVDVDEDSVLISLPLEVEVSEGTIITFANSSVLIRTTTAQSSTGPTLSVADTNGLLVGTQVFGFGIDENTLIEEIVNETDITLSKDTLEPVAANTLLTIINMTAHGVIKTEKGTILTDPTGAPIVVKASENQYRIPSILFDGRLFASDMPNDQTIVSTIAQRLQNFANQVDEVDAGLTESSDAYYKPARTMGNAVFGIGNNETITMPLSLGLVVTVYVDEAVYNTPSLRESMTQTIYRIVNTQIQLPMVSSSKIADEIKDALGTNIPAVEVSGINNDCNLRLIALEDSSGSPGIEYKLVLLSDGSIDRVPNITVNYLPKPSTVPTIAADRL